MTGPGFGAARGDGNDALSQKGIDQLLGAGAALPGARYNPAVEVVPYDFLRPPRISRDRRVQLESIFSRCALSMQSMLSSRLRTPMDVTCSIEQATFSEYVLSLGNPCAAFVFDLGGAEGGQGVIDLSIDLAFYVIDRVFGGPGEMVPMQRGLTPLECTVSRGVVEKLLGVFREAWADHIPFAPDITGFESNPEMLQIIALEGNVLVVNLAVRAGQLSAVVAMCIPLPALETFLADKGVGRGPTNRQQATPVQRATVETAVRGSQVDVVARFPMLRLAAREVAGLKIGQIIQTTQPIDGPVELHVNGARRFVGQIGQYRRMLGLRITDAVEAGAGSASPRASRGRIQ